MSMLADCVAGVLRRQPELPLTIFGHSMGAILGFEVVRRLEADGYEPAHLFASGRRAPSCVRDENVHLRDDDGILAELRTLNGTASAVLNDDEMMRAVLPSLRADYTANETYRSSPGATVRCPVTTLTGGSDPKTTMDEARAWAGHTTGPFDLRVFPGGHFFLTDHTAEINRMLAAALQADRTSQAAR
jgi:surfactin synthase thioesterase subunit